MPSNATLAITELAAKLTPVAPVRTGRAALETTGAALPVITIWNQSDTPTPDQAYCSPSYRRALQIEIKFAADASFDVAMNDYLSAVRTALKPVVGEFPLKNVVGMRETGVAFLYPADNGSIAAIQISIEFDYLEFF